MKNKWINISILVEIALICVITYAPPFQEVFGTANIDAHLIFLSTPIIPIMLIFEEGRKYLVRRDPNCRVARLTAY